jgi:hypothetical protein
MPTDGFPVMAIQRERRAQRGAGQRNGMRRVIVRRSLIYGKGVFAVRGLSAGERILGYKGELMS